jgi:putative ABC transport system permease protein
LPYVFYPFAQTTGPALSGASLLARGPGGSDATLSALRTAVQRVDPTLPFYDERTIRAQLDQLLAPQRFGRTLLGALGLLALLLSGIGIYGVTAYTVATARREIGIRMALGASAGAVVRSVVARTALATGIGGVVGLALAAALVRTLETFLYEVAPLDPLAFAWAAAALAVTALVATSLPAGRAVRVDPAEMTRGDGGF